MGRKEGNANKPSKTAITRPRDRSLSPLLLARTFHQPAMIYFQIVAETSSVRECSRRLNVASSAVSRQIVHLEDALGLMLFQRTGRRLKLTAAGEILHRHIRRIESPLKAAVAELEMLRGLKTGTVRIATAETVGLSLLPELLAGFAAHYPTVHLDVSIASSADVVARVADDRADVGFAFMTNPPAGMKVTAKRTVQVGALMRTDHALADMPELTVAACFAHPVAIGQPGLSIRDAIEPLIARDDLLRLPVIEAGSLALLMELARAGRHVAIVNSLGGDTHQKGPDLVFLPLRDPELPPHVFGLILRETADLHFAPAVFHDYAATQMNKNG